MPDSGAIDRALMAKLRGDATLMASMVDGVYYGIGGKNATRFVIVNLMSALDTHMFGGRAYEGPIYLVKAVEKSTSGENAEAAEARIDALLEQATLTVAGYGAAIISRVERMPRYVEVDPSNQDTRWQHRGGMYEVVMAPNA